jgi:tetratricopeptide (TPR) repeat protein
MLVIERKPLNPPILLFCLSVLIGLLSSYSSSASSAKLLLIAGGVFLYLLLVKGSTSKRFLKVFIASSMLIGMALSAYFVSQSEFEERGKIPLINRVGASISSSLPDLPFPLPHPEAMAGLLEALIPLGLALALGNKGALNKLVYGFCTASMCFALAMTSMRGSWLALASCAILWLFGKSKKTFLGCTFLFLTTLLFLGVYVGVGELLSKAIAALKTAPVLNRANLWRGAWYLIKGHLFTGIGLGCFSKVYSGRLLYTASLFAVQPRNLYLHIWLEQGVLGIASFAWIVIAFYTSLLRCKKRSNILSGSFWSFTTILLHGIVDSLQYSSWTLPVIFIPMGLAMGQIARGERQWGGGKARFLLSLCVLTLIVASFFNIRPLISAFYTNAGSIYQAKGEFKQGLTESDRGEYLRRADAFFEKALEYDKQNTIAREELQNVRLLLGGILIITEDVEQAIAYLKRVDMKPSCEFEGRKEEILEAAQASYEFARKFHPDFVRGRISWLYYSIGHIFEESEEYEVARCWYTLALLTNPNNEDAATKLSR